MVHLGLQARDVNSYDLVSDHVRPAYVKSLDVAPEIPLIAIFSGADAYAAQTISAREAERARSPVDTEVPGSSTSGALPTKRD